MHLRRLFILTRNTLGAAALVGATVLVSAGSANAAPSNVPGTDVYGCPNGYSCYYDYHNGGTKIWTAPNCGFFNLGSMGLGDRISFIDNNSNSYLLAYNYGGSAGWLTLGGVLNSIPPHSVINYYEGEDNVMDGVTVICP